MAYHTGLYLFLFLPAVLLVYQITPEKKRWLVLLLAGYVFFFSISGKLVLYLAGTSLFTHYIGIWLGWTKMQRRELLKKTDGKRHPCIKKQYRRKERQILFLGTGSLLAVLGYLKYYNFFAETIHLVLKSPELSWLLPAKSLLLPVGISFYTLQAIGYLADVYWEKIPAETHPGKIALFLGFFPQIMEGPISMYSQTADALWEGKSLKAENLSAGCLRILWGLCKKLVIADRLSVMVSAIFDKDQSSQGILIAAGAVAYTIQLYMEFSGCMDMVIGSGQLFGIQLPENFRRPFAARTAADFWRRWHITLGVWLKTYVFYPVSVSGPVKRWNRMGKNHLGKYLTRLGSSAMVLFPVWLCNGLWHGPRWNYIFYGMYYFLVLLAGIAVEPIRDSVCRVLKISRRTWYYAGMQIVKTWVIILVGELLFRANGLGSGIRMMIRMVQNVSFSAIRDGSLLELGLGIADMWAIAAGCVLVGLVGILREKEWVRKETVSGLSLPVRWLVFYSLILTVVLFGAYGEGYQQVDLIYAGF